MLPFRPLLEPAANFAALRSGIVKPTRRGKLPQQHVADRHNRAIFLRLTHVDDEEHPFVVGVYHMPCVWWDTHVMTMHAALVVQALQTYADSLPHALLGDFNIKPEDTAYALITTGRLDPENMAQVQQHLYPTWTPSVHPMRSAYAQVGEEPDYTNHTFSGGRAFTGTLDYIFMSPHFTAKHVIETPALAMSTPICPNHEEPSDHILIGATLDLDPDAGQQQDAEAEPLDQGADEGSHL